MQEFTGPLAPPIVETVERFKKLPGVSGIFLVVFTDDFQKITVANTVPHQLQGKVLRAALERIEPERLVLPA
jgi:hypothetical protein